MRFKIFDSLIEGDEYHTIYDMIVELQNKVKVLEENYNDSLTEIKRLENSLDARIDILAEYYYRIDKNV